MQALSAQMTLALGLKDEATFDNFFTGKNVEMVAGLKDTAIGIGEQILYICGTSGQGRSHLLQACCHRAHQHQLSSVYLPLVSLQSLSPDVLIGLESLALVCIDDLQAIAGQPEWEEAIFNLFNRVYDAGGRIVMAANELPKAINIGLPDLVSRLSWGIVYQLHPLSDEEKLSVLTMRANRRGIPLSEDVAKYILTHCPRHMGTLFSTLDTLDAASLVAQRRLTIPFVKEVLHI